MTGWRSILHQVLVPIASGMDIVTAHQRGRRMAEEFGCWPKGLATADLLAAMGEEFKENEIPNTTNPDDWAKIAGKKGERVLVVRLVPPRRSETRREVEGPTGQCL